MGLVKEFREFAVKGNVLDLAIAVVIGAAFGKIVSSIVNDIIMPPLGIIIGGRRSVLRILVLDRSIGLPGMHKDQAASCASYVSMPVYGSSLPEICTAA